jgi:hypothetical protein
MKEVTIWKLVMLAGITTTTLISCDNKPQQMHHQVNKAKQNNDSIARINAEAKKARITFEDSVAIYAWGDVKFGMTQKEVLQTKAFKGATKYDFGLAMSGANTYAIEKSLYLFSSLSIWAYFGGDNNNELTKIEISGSDSWDRFNHLTEALQRLMAKFEVKYGKPKNVFTDLESLKYTDLDKAKTMIIADWKLGSGKSKNGTKLIDIEMNTCSETSYEYKITIHNPAFPKHPKKKPQKEIDEEKKQAQKTKEVMENSF